jgi:iron(III) transport system permease protein
VNASRLASLMRDPAAVLVAACALVFCFLILYPLFWLFYGSFTYGGATLQQTFAQLAALPGLGRALERTILIVVGTVPLAFVFALPLVWITTRTDTPLKGLIDLAAILPFITPPLIGAVAWALLAAPRSGVINVLAQHLGATGTVVNIYSMGGLIFVMALYLSPYVFLTVKAVMERMDASLEEASYVAGAGIGATIRNVLVPIAMPAMFSAGILVFTRAMEEFAIPGVLGVPAGIYTVTTYIYYQAISYVPPRYEIAAVLASALMTVTALCLVLQARILGARRRYTTVSGKGQAPRLLRLGRARYLTLAYALGYIFLTVGLPFLVLIYAAFIKFWGLPPALGNLTFANIVATFNPELSALRGLQNSLVLAVSGATLATVLTLAVGYLMTRGSGFLRGALGFIGSIPLAMPGPVIAVAFLWAYLHPPFVLYGTLWILLLAYVTQYLPYGLRTITSSFRQISDEFERAAEVCGAGRFTRFREIVLPLVRPGIVAGWLLMFVSMIRELSSSIFLFVPGTETTAVALLSMWQESRFSYVAVLALTLILISAAVVAIVRRLFGAGYLASQR